MKRKLLALLLAFTCVISLGGCATTDKSTSGSEKLSDDLLSFQVSIDGTVHQFPMPASDFKALGWTYEDDESQTLSPNQTTTLGSWEKDDISLSVKMANPTSDTVTTDECIITGISLDSYDFEECNWDIILPKNIQLNVSSKEDIIAAYGNPTRESDLSGYYFLTYESDFLHKVVLLVNKETNILERIEIDNVIVH